VTGGVKAQKIRKSCRVIDPHDVLLRAERAGTGSGRLYTIAIGCTDGAGNRASHGATVPVSK
jgi:hypothetical protein